MDLVLERIFIALLAGLVGFVIGILLGFIGIKELIGFPATYFLGIGFAAIGLLAGTSFFSWLKVIDIFDLFTS